KIDISYQRALKILTENKDKLTLLADKLLEKEVIFRDDLELIFGKSKFEEELKEEKKVSKKKPAPKNGSVEKEAEVEVEVKVDEEKEENNKPEETSEKKS
ncbi:MAG: peptidase M41, partial [Flavobacteriales bacterium]|nr:peptidase M41 [Flavobacteriales bacterium]